MIVQWYGRQIRNVPFGGQLRGINYQGDRPDLIIYSKSEIEDYSRGFQDPRGERYVYEVLCTAISPRGMVLFEDADRQSLTPITKHAGTAVQDKRHIVLIKDQIEVEKDKLNKLPKQLDNTSFLKKLTKWVIDQWKKI